MTNEKTPGAGVGSTVGLGPKRYLLCPGNVMSKIDRQCHHVSAHNLARLYGVRMDQCDVRPERMFARLGWRPQPGLIELHPRYDGNYRVPAGPNAG